MMPTRPIIVIDVLNINAGGALGQVTSFSRYARDRGWQVHLYCRDTSAYRAAIEGDAITVRQPRVLRAFERVISRSRGKGRGLAEGMRLALTNLWRNRYLPGEIGKVDADVLLNPNAIIPRAGTGRCKKVVMSQNMLPFDPVAASLFRSRIDRLKIKAIRREQRAALAKADGVVFISGHAQSVITADTRPFGRSVMIPLGADDNLFFPAYRDPNGIEPSNKIIYISDFLPYKHHREVVTALAEVDKQVGRDWSVRFIGDDWRGERNRIMALSASLGLEGNLLYENRLAAREVGAALRAASIGLFASSCENCPTVLIEMMRTGMPIASSGVGPMAEILSNAGLLFDPRRPTEIVAQIVKLLRDSGLRRSLGDAALKRGGEFTIERHNQALLAFVSSLLAPGPC